MTEPDCGVHICRSKCQIIWRQNMTAGRIPESLRIFRVRWDRAVAAVPTFFFISYCGTGRISGTEVCRRRDEKGAEINTWW